MISNNRVTGNAGSHEGVQSTLEESTELCLNHDECNTRIEQMKVTKGFTAKEHVKGHMVSPFSPNLMHTTFVYK